MVQEKGVLEKKVESLHAKVAHLTEKLRKQDVAQRHWELLEALSAKNITPTEAEAPMEVTNADAPEPAVAVPTKREKEESPPIPVNLRRRVHVGGRTAASPRKITPPRKPGSPR